MAKKNDKILIEIAAYRDPELLNTVNSAIIQADNPDRVYFAICLQSDDLDVLEKLKKIKNCRIKYLKEADARGSCYARYLCQQLIEDEEYIYQVDSHMRFVKHWDTKMIEELLSLNDKKACISFYPPDCLKDMMSLPLDDKIFDNPCEGGSMYTMGFNSNGSHFLACNCNPGIVDLKEKPVLKKDPFISAGNFFAFADIHREVLHDPNMYFYGDELAMALRYYTHGWNNYYSSHSYIYHKYNRPDVKWPQRPEKYASEDVRFDELLNLDGKNFDMGEFSLGKERTIEDFEKFAGINFKRRTVTMAAETGVFDDPKLKQQYSLIKDRKYKREGIVRKEEKIEVIVIDLLGNYKECIKNCLDAAIFKNNTSFLVATIKKDKPGKTTLEKQHIKKLINMKKDFSYTEALSSLVEHLGDNYALVVDSAVVFLDGWDNYSITEMRKCGDNGALTNWVWYRENPNADVPPSYYNIIKELQGFEYYLPVFRYNESIKLEDIKTPYKTPWISDGFLFCNSKVLKEVEIDPNINYYEHQYLYSLRLWTNGIDIYYPTTSFFFRTESQDYLNIGDPHYGIITALAGYNTYDSRKIAAGYKYDIGTKRPLWGWYKEIGYDYTIDRAYEIL